VRIDTHLHAYADAAQGAYDLNSYPIVEYGEFDDVRFAGVSGTVEDAITALAEGGFDYAALLGSYELPGLPHPPADGRHWPQPPALPDFAAELVAYNRWLCDVGNEHPILLPFVTANPAVMGSDEAQTHLDEAFGDWGARGLKLHPIAIRTYPDDPGLAGVYAACERAGAPVVFHGGPDVRGYGWSVPEHFAALATARPDLEVIVAHLGGAAWRDTAALAAAAPRLHFDVSEIVNWIGAPKAPTADDVVALVRAIGVERVLLGSDFPWYAPAEAAAAVEALPGLSPGERDAILGDNAARLLRI
jgi:predicted TIM-barrel fold metal-dependent hydrolase